MITKIDDGVHCVARKFTDDGVYVESISLFQSGKVARETIDAQLLKMEWGNETAEWEIKK